GGDYLPVLELLGVLPEVPHVALLVLRLPVAGILGELAVEEHLIPYDRHRHAQDLLGLVGVPDRVDLDALRRLAAVPQEGSRLARQVGIGNLGDEVGWIEWWAESAGGGQVERPVGSRRRRIVRCRRAGVACRKEKERRSDA